jgi:hypothetical protein
MVNWLDKYEQGGLVLKKKTKDNYGKRENANEGYSTAGPGWVGEGTTNKGFDYNGSWGGTMAMGGALPGAVGFTYARTQDPAPSNGKYAKKTLASAQSGKAIPVPTTADSTRLYNSQIALNKFYENEMKAGRIMKEWVSDFYGDTDKDLRQANLDFYRTQIQRRANKLYAFDNEYKKIFNLSPEQVRQLENKGLAQTKGSSEYQEYYRDLVTPMQNLMSPFAIVDKRISPQRRINYLPKSSDYPGGNVTVYDYDPILIKPVNMLTPEERALRIKRYGKDSGIKETVSKPIQKIVSKPEPKPEPEPTPVVEQQPVTTPIQQPTPQPKQLYNYDDGEQLMAPIPNGWGFGTMGGGAVVGVKKKDGTIEYIKPEDYKRMGVPKYGQDYIKSKQKMQKGGVIKDDRGQLAYPGEITEIGSNDITMQGVDYPVLGVSDTGDTQMMYPDQDYKFDGKKVTEFPMAQDGGWLDKYQDGGNINKKLKEEAEERLARMNTPKATISQYTPKPGEQAKFDKQKLERIAENNAPLNRMAASKGAANMQDAALFALDVMGAAEGVGAIRSALKSKAKNVITSKVTRGPVNYWEEPGFAKRNPNFNPEAYANSPVGNTSASRDIPEGMTPYLTMDDVTPNVKPSWKSQELPGLHLSATMEGGPISKIIEPKTGLINVDQALTIIGKESGGASKVDMIKQVLGKDIPKKMDYNDFRKTVQDQLIPLDREVVATDRSGYGIDKLGYTKASGGGKDILLDRINNTKEEILKVETEGLRSWWESDDTYLKRLKENLEIDLKDFNNLPLENQTIRLSNKNKFGKGSSAHGNPEETLGHIHFLRDADTPDVLTMTQLQSDAFQGTHRIMPKNLEEANAKLNKLKDYANYNPSVRTDAELSLEEESFKNFSQKFLLDKNHQERYLQELIDYAGKRSDINKIRVPTSETAAKVQNYKAIDSEEFIEKYKELAKDPVKLAENMADISENEIQFVQSILDGKITGKIYDPEAKTILKKYSEQPKVIKKAFGVEPKTVIDSKGNSWYEFDIPAKFKGGKGEIKAFKDGGWLNKYK